MTEWISIEDQTPSSDLRSIIVFSTGGFIHTVHYEYNDWCLWEMDNGFSGETIEFTHWMPLPPDPDD